MADCILFSKHVKQAANLLRQRQRRKSRSDRWGLQRRRRTSHRRSCPASLSRSIKYTRRPQSHFKHKFRLGKGICMRKVVCRGRVRWPLLDCPGRVRRLLPDTAPWVCLDGAETDVDTELVNRTQTPIAQ